MIKPTVGRVIWFYNSQEEVEANKQPRPAFITYVHSDHLINVGGFNHNGTVFSQDSCHLVQEEDDAIPHGFHARWMPYQTTQAKKHEESERNLAQQPSAPL